MANYFKIGTIRKTKAGGRTLNLNQVPDIEGVYHSENLVEFHRVLTKFIKEPEKGGMYLLLQDPREGVKKMNKTDDEKEAIISRIPDYILQEVTLVTD